MQQEIDGLKKMGVDFECNMVIGKVLTIDELMDEYGYEAVFVGSGAGLPRFMGIPGESLKGVYSANEFLTRSNLMRPTCPPARPPSAPAKGRRCGRRQRGYGRCPQRPASGCRDRVHRLPPRHG